jgi:hypothetical protein
MAPKAPITPTICPLCGFSSKRITTIHEHFLEQHNISAEDLYIQQNPNAEKCHCGCGEKTKFVNYKQGFSKFILGHNANIYSSYDEETAKQIALTRGSNWRGTSMWKGKTKETDEKVANRAAKTKVTRKRLMDEGEIVIWNKGLTKETDERLAKYAEDLKQQFATGVKIPWAKGLSKTTDERIAIMAQKVSETHKTIELREKLDKLKRLSEEDVLNKLSLYDANKFEIIDFDVNQYQTTATPNIQVKCKTCNEISYASLIGLSLQHYHCRTCDPAGSLGQRQVADFVKELNANYTFNDRSKIMGEHSRGLELDIFVPENNFAIEYNGLYWHCELHKTSEYHQNKTNMCNDIGIKLFHVFSDEWLDSNKQLIIKSMLRQRLHCIKNKIFARKTQIVQLTSKQKQMFFKHNHIDGDVTSQIAFGLKYNDDIVMAISLRKPFHKKYSQYIEVARVATKLDTVVVGGLSKLTQHIKDYVKNNTTYTNILTYVDTRHGHNDDNTWEKLGWKLAEETPPRFWWTNYLERFNRFKYKADKKTGLSEKEVAKQAGVYKIFGCKNLIYTLTV